MIEFLSHWDPILKERVVKVEEWQKEDERLQVHYLSNESKNEFFAECSDFLSITFFGEMQSAKYHAIIVDFINIDIMLSKHHSYCAT